jgi:hypothetical protein
VATELQLPCNGSPSERLIGIFGGSMLLRNGSAAVAALGAICGSPGESQLTVCPR